MRNRHPFRIELTIFRKKKKQYSLVIQIQTMKTSHCVRPILLLGILPNALARFWVDLVRPEIYASAIVDPYRQIHEDESFLGASPPLAPTTEPPTASPMADIIQSPTVVGSNVSTQIPSLQPTLYQCEVGEYVHVLHMHDSWGDGWSGTTLKITEIQQETSSAESFVRGSSALFSFRVKEEDTVVFEGTLVDGFDQYEYLCLKPNTCYDIHVEGGKWLDEIKWDIRNVTRFKNQEDDVKSEASTVVKGLAPVACQFSMANDTGHFHCPSRCESLTLSPTQFPSDAPSLSPSVADHPTASPSHNSSHRINNETDTEYSLQGDEEVLSETSNVPSSTPSLNLALGRHSQTNAPTLRHSEATGWAKLEPTTLQPTSNDTVEEKRQVERPTETSSPTFTPTLFATYWTTFWSSTYYPSDLGEDGGNTYTPTISPGPSSTYYPTFAYSSTQQQGESESLSPTLRSSFGATFWGTTYYPTSAVTGDGNPALAQFVAENNVGTVHTDSVSTTSTATVPETSAPTPIHPTLSPDESVKHAFIISSEAPVPSPLSRTDVTWASIKEIQPTSSPVVTARVGGSAVLTPVHVVPTPSSPMPSPDTMLRNQDTLLPSPFSFQAEMEEKSSFLNQVIALREKSKNDALQKLIEGREQARANYQSQRNKNGGSE
jgi:hypothetical protein